MDRPWHPELSIRRQCALLGLFRPNVYYKPARESPDHFALMRCIDAQYTRSTRARPCRRGALFPLLQRRAAAPVARLPHASGGAWGGQTLTTRLLIFATSWS